MGLPKRIGARVERYDSKSFCIVGWPLPEPAPLFPTRAKAEAWLTEQLSRLDPRRVPRDRPCLCCGRPFLSEGAHNRLCASCRVRGNALGEDQRPVVTMRRL